MRSAFKILAQAAPVDVSKRARSSDLHTVRRVRLTPCLQVTSLFTRTLRINTSLVIYLSIVDSDFNAIEDCLQCRRSQFAAVLVDGAGHRDSYNTKKYIAIGNYN